MFLMQMLFLNNANKANKTRWNSPYAMIDPAVLVLHQKTEQ